MTDAAFDAQGPGTADRNPRINAEEGATWRMTVRIVARPAEPGQKTPREHGSSLGVRNGGALASINSRVTGKGDDSFNLIWS